MTVSAVVSSPITTVDRVQALGPWDHNIHLPDGTQTAPDHPKGDYPAACWKLLSRHLPDSLDGWTALDVGCGAGFYSIELARRGARVVGIDVRVRSLDQAVWATEQFGLSRRVEYRHMQIYDLAHSSERLDLVLFLGLFHCLRYPQLGLDVLADRVRHLLVFQSPMLAEGEAPEGTQWPALALDETDRRWLPNRAGVEAMLRSSGLRIVGRCPDGETLICEPDGTAPKAASRAWGSEFLAATGRPWRNALKSTWMAESQA